MIRKGYLALLCAIMLTNCTDQFSAVQQINRFDEIPVGVTEELHLIYSDSADGTTEFSVSEKSVFTRFLDGLFGEIPIIGFLTGYVANPSYLCLLYTSPSPRDRSLSRMPSSA